MSFESLISWRQLRPLRGGNVLSGAKLAIVGVILGVATLMLVLAVWTGYESTIKERILGINSHIVVLKYGAGFKAYRDAREKVLAVSGVVAASPFMLRECMLGGEHSMAGALVKAVDPATATTATLLAENVKAGKGKLEWLFKPETLPGNEETKLPAIILGNELAKELEADVGDEIEWISPLGGGLGPSGPIPKGQTARVAGIFHAGMYEYDNKFAYVTLASAQDFFDTGDEVSGLDVRLEELEMALPVAGRLLQVLGGYPYRTRTWMEMNKNLLSALALEKTVSKIIVGFISLVAAFVIVGTLLTMVLEKKKDIAILKAMGATNGSVMRIFIVLGLGIGLFGTLVGIGLGYGLTVAAGFLNIGIDPSVYYLQELPVEVRLVDLVSIVLSALTLSLLATVLPSWTASRLRPADAIRYE